MWASGILKASILAILTSLDRNAPRTPSELRPQFQALCRALDLDPSSPDIMSTLRDPAKVPFSSITRVIETDQVTLPWGTFRGCLDGEWMASTPDPMTWQRNGGFAEGLHKHGINSIVVGHLSEEWYLYSIAHPVSKISDITLNLERYYTADMVQKLMSQYEDLPHNAPLDEIVKRFGEMLCDGQVRLPVRLLVRDLLRSNFPVLRYQISWVPEDKRTKGELLIQQLLPLRSASSGYVTHGADRSLWTLRLDGNHQKVAVSWLKTIDTERRKLEKDSTSWSTISSLSHSPRLMLTLKLNQSMAWTTDEDWDNVMRLASVLPEKK